MRLSSFRIYNFKSIQDTGEIKVSPDDNITVFAGQNESGKSSILEALEFFENGAQKDFEETHRRLNSHPRIECKYLLGTDELDSLESASGSRVLRNYAEKNGFVLVRGKTEEDDFGKIKYVNYDELAKINDAISTATQEVSVDADSQESVAEKFNLYKHLLLIRPKFIFYSSFEDYILPSKITKARLGENQAVEDFEAVFGVDFDMLLNEKNDAARKQTLNQVNDAASDNLNEYWSQKIDDENSNYKFAIDVMPQFSAPETSYVRFFIDQGDNFPLHFGQKSKGFQWFSSFNLRLRAHEASSDNLSEFILLIDEPGQGLHEEAQKDVKRVLDELSNNGVQTLFSTHQAQLLKSDDGVDFSRIKLVTRGKSDGTKIKNIAQSSSQNGFKDALSPVRTAMGLITLDIDSFLNGKRVVIVEGITDYYYVRAFCELAGTKANPINISAIPCTGVSQVPNVFSVLFGWGIKSKVIVDDDSQGTKSYNQIKGSFFNGEDDKTVNRSLFQNKGCRGIEDSFTYKNFSEFSNAFIDPPSGGKSNSELAKGNKEIIGRTFYDKVMNGEIKLSSLDPETQKAIRAIVGFIKK